MSPPGPPANAFLGRPLRTDAVVRLFCLPHAGAGASRYFRWASYLPAEIEVCPLLLPGREGRIREAPFSDLQSLVYALAKSLMPAVDRPFAFFGHSMGALVGFELARCLRRELDASPVHLFASGHRAPQLPDLDEPVHRLPDELLVERVRQMDAAADELFERHDLGTLILPALRADFTLCATYAYYQDAPLSCPISVFGGRADPRVAPGDLAAWSEQTTGELVVRLFAGGHLFVNDCELAVMEAIVADLVDTFQRSC